MALVGVGLQELAFKEAFEQFISPLSSRWNYWNISQ
jgi:hypothetical protein